MVDSEVPATATHPNPVRGAAYMDIGQATLFNLAGVTNTLNVTPASTVHVRDMQLGRLALTPDTSVQSVTAVTEAVRNAFGELLSFVRIMVLAVLVLVLLMAFNTAAINLEARAREHATMFAFGVRNRTALRVVVVENLVIGAPAAVAGMLGCFTMVWWMTQRLLRGTLAEFALNVILQPETLIFIEVTGVLAVTIAPLFTVRLIHTMRLS